MLPLHRYRLAGELAEVRASDLAFSTAEASLLLAQHGKLAVGGLAQVPDTADGGLGGRPPPGRDVPGRSSRP
jgi:LuxR family maltose regulon positive regulatory protein